MSLPEGPSSRHEPTIATPAPSSPRRRTGIIVAAGAVVFVLLAVGMFFAGAALGPRQAAASVATPHPTKAPRTVPAVLPTDIPLASCSVAALTSVKALGTFSGYISDVATGDGVLNHGGKDAVTPSGTQLLLTATTAIGVLGSDYRIPTKVFQGAEPGTIVLVGAGDPTLSRTPAGAESVYPGGAKLSDLASQVTAALGGTPVTRIVLDASYWNVKDSWDSTWSRTAQKKGTLSEVTALQVDGDRADPTKQVSPRSSDPVVNAGRYFRTALGAPNAKLEVGIAPGGTAQLGEVDSPTVGDLVTTMMQSGDLTLAETLARVASKSSGADGSAASLQKVVTGQLAKLGLDTKGVVVRDGSGLSTKNLVPPVLLTKLLVLVKAGANDLDLVDNALSTAGATGGLAERFSGSDSVARGKVFAQVGSSDGEAAMAGIVESDDGTQLAFAFYAVQSPISKDAEAALDDLVANVYSCGGNLSKR